jgi:hypothetical protein
MAQFVPALCQLRINFDTKITRSLHKLCQLSIILFQLCINLYTKFNAKLIQFVLTLHQLCINLVSKLILSWGLVDWRLVQFVSTSNRLRYTVDAICRNFVSSLCQLCINLVIDTKLMPSFTVKRKMMSWCYLHYGQLQVIFNHEIGEGDPDRQFHLWRSSEWRCLMSRVDKQMHGKCPPTSRVTFTRSCVDELYVDRPNLRDDKSFPWKQRTTLSAVYRCRE